MESECSAGEPPPEPHGEAAAAPRTHRGQPGKAVKHHAVDFQPGSCWSMAQLLSVAST